MELEVIKFLWGVLVVPLGWLWLRIRDLQKKTYDNPGRIEVRDNIRDALNPVKEKLDDMHTWLQAHDEREMERYGRILEMLGELKGKQDAGEGPKR